MNTVTPHDLHVHLGYSRLTASSLGAFVSALGAVADTATEMYAHVSGLRPGSAPTLQIEEARTGESIKFKFGEGWLPSVTSDKQNDLVIEVPKKLGVPALVGFLLMNAVKSSLEVKNAYLDGKIKELEKVLKETEVAKLLRETTQSKSSALQDKAKDAVNIIIHNTDYKEFRIYEVEVLNVAIGGHGERTEKEGESPTNNGTEPIQ